MRIVLITASIIQIPPIFDLLIGRGPGQYLIGYLPTENFTDLISRYVSFFGPFSGEPGITPGIRIEIGIIVLLSSAYCWLRTKNIYRSALLPFFVYTIIFIFVSEKFLLRAFVKEYFESNYVESIHELMTKLDAILLFVALLIIFYFLLPRKFLMLLKDISALRILHFEFMILIGFLIGYKVINQSPMFGDYLSLILAWISILLACLFLIITNNHTNLNSDRISNQERAIVIGDIRSEEFIALGWGVFIATILFSFLSSPQTLFLILVFTGNYFIYSMPPIRFKRALFLSKLLIALNLFILIFLGSILSGNNIQFWSFSPLSILLFIIGSGLLINFIDIKDYEGDRANGIRTLPVILGLSRSKLLIGSFFLFIYFILGTLIIFRLLAPVYGLVTMGFGVLEFWFVNKKKYSERAVFIVYLISLCLFSFFILNGRGAELLIK